MTFIGEAKQFKYLVLQKFPGAKGIIFNQPPSPKSDRSGALLPESREILRKEIAAYEAELRKMPIGKLRDLYETERKKEQQENVTNAKKAEKNYFFNLPSAKADLDYWSKTAYWTLEEATALTFGKNPRKVSWNTLKDHQFFYDVSPFVQKYWDIRELAIRANAVKQLSDPCLPREYLTWAQRNKIDVPAELIEKIEAHEADNVDWQARFNKLAIEYASLVEKLKQMRLSGEAPSALARTSYGRAILEKVDQAVEQFPAWKEEQKKIQKSGNLHIWLMETIQADSREAEILKKVLTELFEITN
jgi:hypothetical protein